LGGKQHTEPLCRVKRENVITYSMMAGTAS
jgi:hypothetical protein